MIYNEIIGLHDYFQPAYDLTNEVGTYWKQFIPNKKFFDALTKTLNSIESGDPDESKSLWLQGTYGTGKSHATAVIKHLLYNAWDEVGDYIENLEDMQLNHRLKNFRERKKVFPVVLKGTSSIVNNRTFALVIEKAVKNELKKEGIKISTKNDFEKLIYQIEENPANIDWQKNIDDSKLRLYVNDKEGLIDKLRREDIDILRLLEDASSKNGLHFSHSDISNWLVEVVDELKEKGLADALMIYWDEFTSILELPQMGVLLTELQNIADLSINKDVFLFVVSHRKPYQSSIAREDMEKILDRFKVLDYRMEPITTYHIINASIKKKDKSRWEELKNKQIDDVKPLIQTIIVNEGVKVHRYIEDLFPIHPYTAYLSTFIARNIGSTERSIFTFLYDDKKGFRKFINSNPDTDGNIFLTVDYLWDFFYEEFERTDNEKFSSALERFKLHKQTLEGKGGEYLAIFKGILLLNILHKVAELSESSLVAPAIDNIKSMFQGSKYEKSVDDVLSFVNTEQIITKTPDNLYLISSASLPFREIEDEKKKLSGQYKEINRILYAEHIKEFVGDKRVFRQLENREVEVKLFDAALKDYLLRNKLEKAFEHGHTIHLAVFIGKDNQELEQIRKTITNIKNDEEFKNVIFVIIETILDESTFNGFIDYKARAVVADKHSYTDDVNINEDYAKKVLDEWVRKANSGYLEWVLRNETDKSLINNFNEKLKSELSQKIFPYGFENLKECQGNRNIWIKQYSKTATEIFLFADSLDYIVNKTSTGIVLHLKGIIKDNNGEYVADSNLNFKQNINEVHPLKKMDIEIEKAINKRKDAGTFNLGEVLNFLNKPPYGLYRNMVNMGAMGFLMREYVGKLYEAGTGKPIEKEIMRDKILSLFKYWDDNRDLDKLKVHFGTEEEKELVELLTDLFKLKDVGSLNDVRWKIRDWVKASSHPLWIFKLSEKSNDLTSKAIDIMFQLIQSIDKEITYADIKSYLNTIKDVHYDLGLIIRKEGAQSLFKKWLMGIENVEIPETEIENVIDYLGKCMQEEVASWREDRVREKVKDWWIEKEREKKGKDYSSGEAIGNGGGIISDQGKGGVISHKRVEEMKSRIETWAGDKAKKILIRLIKDKNEIVDDIEKYEGA